MTNYMEHFTHKSASQSEDEIFRLEQLCAQIRGHLADVGVTASDVMATLPEARERIYARRYAS
ncbi:MAG TPA: hypothetical protein VK763_03165 [Terriglobales bacterium]|nr:hypothetical protein [Terriglobales bacterium]